MYEIEIPGISMSEKNVKSAIINILSIDWPLSLKKIYNIINKKYSLGVTYQAVHKAVNLLIKKDILIKNNREYSLNKEWITQLKEFSNKLDLAYTQKIPITKLNLVEIL